MIEICRQNWISSIVSSITWTVHHILFITWTVHHQDCSSHGLFITWTVDHLDCSSHGLFITWSIHHMDCSSQGLFITKTVHHIPVHHITCSSQELLITMTIFLKAIIYRLIDFDFNLDQFCYNLFLFQCSISCTSMSIRYLLQREMLGRSKVGSKLK